MASSIAVLDDPCIETIPSEPASGVRMRSLPDFDDLAEYLAEDPPESQREAKCIRLDGLAAMPSPASAATIHAQEQAIRHLRAAVSMLRKTDSAMVGHAEIVELIAGIELSRMRGLP